jgi:manganese-dependent inorganic pyrophosphatase
LVDHNESAQSISNRSAYTIHSVIDHHKIGDLETGYPLVLRFEPVASTNSVLYKMYKEAGVTIDKKIATLMLGGILSDTLHFRSPTTTEFDKTLVPVLAQIAGIEDVE